MGTVDVESQQAIIYLSHCNINYLACCSRRADYAAQEQDQSGIVML
jgi:hypothetical protein